MNIIFENKALEDLYLHGATKIKPYHILPTDIIKQYIKVVNYLRAANRIEELFLIKSLHYEKKKGNLQGVEAVWINKQYRLFFHSKSTVKGIFVQALLFDISKHYE